MKSSSIISGGLIIVSSFLMYYFISPNIQTIKLKNENIKKLNKFIEDAKSIQARRDDLKNQHNQISEKTLKYIKDILPVFTDSTLAQGLIALLVHQIWKSMCQIYASHCSLQLTLNQLILVLMCYQ